MATNMFIVFLHFQFVQIKNLYVVLMLQKTTEEDVETNQFEFLCKN